MKFVLMSAVRRYKELLICLTFLSCLMLKYHTLLAANDLHRDLIVQTKNGAVQGIRLRSMLKQRSFLAFRGIPFAKPPVGKLRFKLPRKPEPWKGILNASDYGPMCFQLGSGQEDCLYLNVFVPDFKRSSATLPVMVYIHGGGFRKGNSMQLNPEILMDEDIVLVSIAYRLGPFGFLSLNTPEYSGNMGLKDQLMALKWINKNIHSFGGDRKKITIFGHSAGSFSVGFHLLSHASRNLFQQAIFDSGCHLNPMALSKRNNTQFMVKLYAAEKSIAEKDVTLNDIIKWLKTVDGKYLFENSQKPLIINGESFKEMDLTWAPVIEAHDALNAFLNKPIDKYLKETNAITTLFGYSSAEAMTYLYNDLMNPDILKAFDEKFEIQLPLLGIKYDFQSKDYQKAVKEVRKTYFGDRHIDKSTLNEYVQLISDITFAYGTYVAAKTQAKQSSGKTYLYRFSFVTEMNSFRKYVKADTSGIKGAMHGESSQLFSPRLDYSLMKRESREFVMFNNFISFYVNFVKFGNPTPNGKPVTLLPIEGDNVNYVDITNDGYIVGVNPQSRVFKFWDEFLIKYKNVFQSQ